MVFHQAAVVVAFRIKTVGSPYIPPASDSGLATALLMNC